jgi:transcriptional regulator with XRE-family HTH domain
MAPAQRSEFARRFGANLARARRDAGLSQEELSFRASPSDRRGQLERGERVGRADTLFKLACGLSFPIEIFFEGMDWKSPLSTTGMLEFE